MSSGRGGVGADAPGTLQRYVEEVIVILEQEDVVDGGDSRGLLVSWLLSEVIG
ncbi:hypothetical protein [Thioalkalivibrio sp.]|uniref:hypothetical protein n=1 Tax=Thioalkalivibrio sp. TaxID=2093813 RepID=UPI0025EB6E9E|nr:hypothetical protein [Thioalkalivibrio sp.]